MHAPIYRHIEADSELLGLSFPSEVVTVLLAFWAAALLGDARTALLVTASSYVALRLLRRGKQPLFLLHAISYLVRRHLYGGHLSAMARARTPRFPFGHYACLELRHHPRLRRRA